ncbi:MAG TPA: SDR family NAD(P)-dependent oxidoreductase [Streptosporangiaceae bacterium]|nr:SDR family NAD(P)-dependent oxidoreductase [Streptosporangiaceae bacterium]
MADGTAAEGHRDHGRGRGIGAAMVRRFAAEHPDGLVLSDRPAAALDPVAADAEAAGCATLTVPADVMSEAGAQALTSAALDRFGRVDLFCSNAGVATGGTLPGSIVAGVPQVPRCFCRPAA